MLPVILFMTGLQALSNNATFQLSVPLLRIAEMNRNSVKMLEDQKRLKLRLEQSNALKRQIEALEKQYEAEHGKIKD